MRRLIYVPIIHTSADLGSIAAALEKRGLLEFGQKDWESHKATVAKFWETLSSYFETLEATGLKIYQDGMVADEEVGRKIAEDGQKLGSENYQIILRLLEKGARLVKTEDFVVVKRERDHIVNILKMKGIKKLVAIIKYKVDKRRLLAERDTFIARVINESLGEGETGILFLGAYHDVLPMLAKDISVKVLKERKKVVGYQEGFLRPRNREKLKELASYLTSPIT